MSRKGSFELGMEKEINRRMERTNQFVDLHKGPQLYLLRTLSHESSSGLVYMSHPSCVEWHMTGLLLSSLSFQMHARRATQDNPFHNDGR